MNIDLSKIKSISLDISGFPQSILEIRREDNSLIAKKSFPTHSQGKQMLFEINSAWVKELKNEMGN